MEGATFLDHIVNPICRLNQKTAMFRDFLLGEIINFLIIEDNLS